MTTPSSAEQPASPDQLAELKSLAEGAGEEVPDGITAAEAEQRLVELRANS